MSSLKELRSKEIIFGVSLGGIVIAAYLIYKALGDYQTGKQIENIDKSLAKLAGTTPYSSKVIDKLTLKATTDKLGNEIEKLV